MTCLFKTIMSLLFFVVLFRVHRLAGRLDDGLMLGLTAFGCIVCMYEFTTSLLEFIIDRIEKKEKNGKHEDDSQL